MKKEEKMSEKDTVQPLDAIEKPDHAYKPAPLDTSDVKLPKDLLDLTEQIASNVHDIWAKGRISEGWKYGTIKDPEAKTTPLLVPYADLSESEKQYDRNTALETLKMIVKLGYRIQKNDSDT